MTEVDGCRIFGRYFVQRDDAPEVSAGFATGRASYCLRQAAMWKAKRIAKALGGRCLLARASSDLRTQKLSYLAGLCATKMIDCASNSSSLIF